MAKQKMDMLHGSLWDKLILYAFPVAATGILEQLFNASDLTIVGNFTGDAKTVCVAAVTARSLVCCSTCLSELRWEQMLLSPMRSGRKMRRRSIRRYILLSSCRYWVVH